MNIEEIGPSIQRIEHRLSALENRRDNISRDTERLDWLHHAGANLIVTNWGSAWVVEYHPGGADAITPECSTPREAIDAAMLANAIFEKP